MGVSLTLRKVYYKNWYILSANTKVLLGVRITPDYLLRLTMKHLEVTKKELDAFLKECDKLAINEMKSDMVFVSWFVSLFLILPIAVYYLFTHLKL